MVASSYALANAVAGPCGCFGKFLTMSHPVSLSIDVLILIAALILLFNREKEFISIGQIVQRFHIKSSILNAGSRMAVIVLVTAAIGFGAIGIHNLTKQPETQSETVVIPSPLAADVDAALLQHKPVLMEFYIDGCQLCQAAAPIIYDMDKEFANKIVLLRIDYRQYFQNSEVVTDLSITNIPTVLVIAGKNSEGKYIILGRFEGGIERNALHSSIEQSIKNQ
jgi:thiol:disulfide interchange protein